MNFTEPMPPAARGRWPWATLAGLALTLVALFLWTGSGGGRRLLAAWLGCGGAFGTGLLMERRPAVARTFGHLLMAGGIAGVFGTICAAESHGLVVLLQSQATAWLLLALCAAALLWFSDACRSQWLAMSGLGLAWMGVTLQQFTVFSLAANLLLILVALRLRWRRGWIAPVWLMLVAIHLGFLLGWPFSEHRVDADRFLELTEYRWSLAFFTAAWAAFTWIAACARGPRLASKDEAATVTPSVESAQSVVTISATTFPESQRLIFATLANAAFFFIGVLMLPPRHPEWFWKFTLATGFVFLLAWVFSDRFPTVRRAHGIHGALLVALGAASAVAGREPAAMLAVASAFFVLTCEEPRQWLLRYSASVAGLLAVAFAWEPVYRSDAPSLWLGVVTGVPLVFNSIWISRHRAWWERWSVLLFGTLGLGTWLLTTLAHLPAIHRPPVLALEAVIVTFSIFVLGIAEYPMLASGVLLLAIAFWFQQLGDFNARSWWNPLVVVLATLAISRWWQTRGRALIPACGLRWLEGVTAAAAVAILLLWIEGGVGTTATALVLVSSVAILVSLYAAAVRDRFLFVFAQLFTATAAGELIAQLLHAPLPRGFAALFPVVTLLALAPLLAMKFRFTPWERVGKMVASFYRVVAAALFVAWAFHFVPAAARMVVLGVVAILLLIAHFEARPAGPLNGSLICAAGALLAFWLGSLGMHGFRLVDLLGFFLLLVFGRLLRRHRLVSGEVQAMGIVLGLGALTYWVWSWMNVSFSALPMTVSWALVAATVICVGWRLGEYLFLVFGWSLLALALGRAVWVDLVQSRLPIGSDPAFRIGLLGIGLAAIVAALAYARRARREGRA